MSSIYDPSSPLARELLSDEKLVWQGAPARGIRFRPSDALMIPFSLLWGGFAFFWEASVLGIFMKGSMTAIDNPIAIIFPLWGLPFCLVGLYMIIGRFFYDAYNRSKTVYGLTDKRVIILKGRKVTALNLKNLPEIAFSESQNGEGTIRFGPETPLFYRGGSRFPVSPAFEMIKDARSVYKRIQELQSAL